MKILTAYYHALCSATVSIAPTNGYDVVGFGHDQDDLLYIQGVFLLLVVFDLASCLYFSSDLLHRILIFFVGFCAIYRGINHASITSRSREINQSVKGVFYLKHYLFFDFSL